MPSSESYDATGIEYYDVPTFKFACGITLNNVRVAYRSINPTSTAGTILIPTCYGGHINTTLTFTSLPASSPTSTNSPPTLPGALSAYHIVVVAMLGNSESASPSNTPHFPPAGSLRYSDVIRSQHHLLTSHLGLNLTTTPLEAVLGFSMAAQQAYHWGVMYPTAAKRIIPICGSARTSGHNYAFLEGPLGALLNNAGYLTWAAKLEKQGGGGEDAAAVPPSDQLQSLTLSPDQRPDPSALPAPGLRAFGRAYAAWLTSAGWYRGGWWGRAADGGMGFASIEEYIANGCEAGFTGWDPRDLVVLARMWQVGDVSLVIPAGEKTGDEEGEGGDDPLQSQLSIPPGGGWINESLYRAALASITAKVLLMPCATDQYFPAEDGEIEMKYLKRGTWAPIPSVWGHVAGGGGNPEDVRWMDEQIGKFMMDE